MRKEVMTAIDCGGDCQRACMRRRSGRVGVGGEEDGESRGRGVRGRLD